MDENEKLQAGLAQGLTTDQKDFEEIRNDAFDGFDETNKQTPERSYEILRKNRSILRPQKGRFSGFYL